MNFDLKKHTILLTIAGSRAYGMNTATSDVDVKGVCIPPKECRNGFLHMFDQADKKEHMINFMDTLTDEERIKGLNGELEGSVYDIRKFFSMASQVNPNILDILFCSDKSVRLITKAGEILRDHKTDFLTTKVRWTFGGYARSQLKKIESHRRWLLHPPTHKPTRAEFGLPKSTLIPANQLMAAQAAIKKKIDSWEIDYGSLDEADKIYIQDQLSRNLAEMKIGVEEKFMVAARSLGYDDNFIELLDKERRYRGAMTNFNQYLDWQDERNEERAKLEAQFGYDTKHGSHLVRLLRMCTEILTHGKVNVLREDAEELLSIRRGEWSYDDLMGFVEAEEAKIEEAYINSKLPKVPDREKLDKLCCELVERFNI